MLRFFLKGHTQLSPIDKFKGIKAPFYALLQEIGIFNNMTIFHTSFGMSIIFDRLH
jgi:hypothetical protein